MRILELEQKFQSQDILNEVLEELKDDLGKVDYWAGCLRGSIVDNIAEANKALGELTGTYSNLRTVLGIAETEKKNREVRRYNEIRIDKENAGTKFTSASAEKEASAYVADYRRIRNIILGYVEACSKDISSLQSILKNLDRESKQPIE